MRTREFFCETQEAIKDKSQWEFQARHFPPTVSTANGYQVCNSFATSSCRISTYHSEVGVSLLPFLQQRGEKKEVSRTELLRSS
jgi:hypothetical protein